jgi:hypothetical protein
VRAARPVRLDPDQPAPRDLKRTMSTEREQEARRLVDLYDERIRLTHEMAQSERPTGAMAQAVLDKGAELDRACEAFRRRYYPRRHQVIVGLRTVMVASKTRRSVESIYDANGGLVDA